MHAIAKDVNCGIDKLPQTAIRISTLSGPEIVRYPVHICAQQGVERDEPRLTVDGIVRRLWCSCQQLCVPKLFKSCRQTRHHDISDVIGIENRIECQFRIIAYTGGELAKIFQSGQIRLVCRNARGRAGIQVAQRSRQRLHSALYMQNARGFGVCPRQ